MPYINIRVGRALTAAEITALAERVGKAVETIPEKFYEKTMVDIEDDHRIYRGGRPTECLFLEARMMGRQSPGAVAGFMERLYTIFEETLGIPNTQIYMTILELDNWASKGEFRRDMSMVRT